MRSFIACSLALLTVAGCAKRELETSPLQTSSLDTTKADSTCAQCAAQHAELLEEQAATIREQAAQIDALREDVTSLKEDFAVINAIAAAATQTYSEDALLVDWHTSLINRNQAAYDEIAAFLETISEDRFPIARTWYGKDWLRLTEAFRQQKFPAPEQRDALVSLLDDIRHNEQKRLELVRLRLADQQSMQLAGAQGQPILEGPEWNRFYSKLKSLEY